ncbi:GntR family transcriptional regulator [uncultured Enterovirga sp.]|uniref:GntR family transcriptional regulator n=1 Tax=uncultured Enterovirga sp. TaxID=2026352 RepID=UPI0035CAA310
MITPGDLAADDQGLPLAEQVYRRLRAEIRAGDLRSGHRLKEMELAARLRVSRTPIREAVRRLVSEGLVEVVAARGMAITTLDRQKVRELYALREALEGTAARMAAQHASPGDLATMRSILDAWRAMDDPAEIARRNRQFHEAIRDAAHNGYLEQALTQLSNSLALLPGTTFELPGRAAEAHEEHLAMLRAIEERDSDAADAKARGHIAQAGQARFRIMFGAV